MKELNQIIKTLVIDDMQTQQGFLRIISSVFDLELGDIAYMMTPTKVRSTVYNWKQRGGYEMKDVHRKQIVEFICKNARGRDPKRALKVAIDKRR